MRCQEDTEGDYGNWDFLTLHRASRTADEYDASQYCMGKKTGDLRFCAPIEPGQYAISVVRDLSIVLNHMAIKEVSIEYKDLYYLVVI